MNRILRLAVHDLRLILRDSMLTLFLVVPFLLVAVVRYGVPALTAAFPVIAPYHGPIAMAAGLQTSLLAGFVSSFLLLEEKDEEIFTAIRVLPIGTLAFLSYRLLFATVWAALGAGLVLVWGGVAYPGTGAWPLLVSLYGLMAPLITLVIATIAANKIEGMAYFKIVNLILILPLGIFFLPEWVSYLVGWIPTYWLFRAYAQSLELGSVPWGTFAIGLGVYGIWIGYFYRRFSRNVFGR